uniref:Uncharacterized protein n=1 Tax=Populus trichocarpa TaxID=3694 RepID=A0A2K1YHL7_POPTR
MSCIILALFFVLTLWSLYPVFRLVLLGVYPLYLVIIFGFIQLKLFQKKIELSNMHKADDKCIITTPTKSNSNPFMSFQSFPSRAPFEC